MTVKQISQQERMVLRLIPIGASKARPIAEISRLTGISARNIKDIVRTLVVKYEIPVIGARYGTQDITFLKMKKNNVTELSHWLHKQLVSSSE